jgi:hypothetical protein
MKSHPPVVPSGPTGRESPAQGFGRRPVPIEEGRETVEVEVAAH